MTNGYLHRVENGWVVSDLKPHISIRFKDVFKGIPTGTVPPFHLKDRPDIAADLDWFMQRFPLTMDQETQCRLSTGVRNYRHAQAQMDALRDVAYVAPERPGFKDGEAAMPYQR